MKNSKDLEDKKNLKKSEKIEKTEKIKEKNVEKVKPEKVLLEDDEPSWYHYVLVLLVLFGSITLIYFGYEYYDMKKKDNLDNYEPLRDTFIYDYKLGNVTYNLEFHNTFDYIERHNITVEVRKEDIWQSRNITFAFYEYNGTDNRYVSTASVKFMKLLKYVYNINFDETNSFKMVNEVNCSTSTLKSKVVVFYPYSDRNGVFYNQSNGCIEVLSRTPKEMVLVEDTLMYKLVVSEDVGIGDVR